MQDDKKDTVHLSYMTIQTSSISLYSKMVSVQQLKN